MDDLAIPGWYGWVVLALVVPGLIVLIGVVIAFLFHRTPRIASEGARYFHVLGFDPKTNASREVTLLAEGPSAARRLAQLQGIVVTDVTPVVLRPEPQGTERPVEAAPEEDAETSLPPRAQTSLGEDEGMIDDEPLEESS